MLVIVMGVTGVGKTTVGQLLAEKTGWPLYDADDYHSAANVEKMRAGIPLTDDDRWPWLDRLNALLRNAEAKGKSAILACSALKQRYRDRLQQGLSHVRWVHLKGDMGLIRSRLSQRKGHYMNPALLQSQFDALEAPLDALIIDVDDDPPALAQRVLRGLQI
ncbi:MAG TPA: gluconokinase [Burkholderiales bacterium]|nr:gluconokinase [Burkholderiales bacterium]